MREEMIDFNYSFRRQYIPMISAMIIIGQLMFSVETNQVPCSCHETDYSISNTLTLGFFDDYIYQYTTNHLFSTYKINKKLKPFLMKSNCSNINPFVEQMNHDIAQGIWNNSCGTFRIKRQIANDISFYLNPLDPQMMILNCITNGILYTFVKKESTVNYFELIDFGYDKITPISSMAFDAGMLQFQKLKDNSDIFLTKVTYHGNFFTRNTYARVCTWRIGRIMFSEMNMTCPKSSDHRLFSRTRFILLYETNIYLADLDANVFYFFPYKYLLEKEYWHKKLSLDQIAIQDLFDCPNWRINITIAVVFVVIFIISVIVFVVVILPQIARCVSEEISTSKSKIIRRLSQRSISLLSSLTSKVKDKKLPRKNMKFLSKTTRSI